MSGKIYFASDFHLGLKAGHDPLEREKRVVKWLAGAAEDASEINLLGDVFDFWWEYSKVVPKGYTRFLGFVAQLTDNGIPVHFFTGNHDMWVGKYLTEECGITIHTEPIIRTIDGKVFYLAHGEGLGTGNMWYKALLSFFRNRPARALYSFLHPAIGIRIGQRWSLSSRLGKGISLEFLGEEKEDLFRHSRKILETTKVDYFIYGHRHLPMISHIPGGAQVTILGDWITSDSFAVWDGEFLRLRNSL